MINKLPFDHYVANYTSQTSLAWPDEYDYMRNESVRLAEIHSDTHILTSQADMVVIQSQNKCCWSGHVIPG